MTTNQNNMPNRPLTDVEKAKLSEALKNAATAVPQGGKPATVETKPNEGKATVAPVITTTVPATVPAATPDTGAAATADKAAGDDHKAAMAAANANAGKPENGKPDTAQGGTAGGKAKGSKVNVSAAKPKKQGKAATAMANDAYVYGYDLGRWPKVTGVNGAVIPAPDALDIAAAIALNIIGNGPTANGLAMAFYLSANATQANIYDVGLLVGTTLGPVHKGDHKANVAQKAMRAGFVTLNTGTRVADRLTPNGRPRVCYVCKPTARGLGMITKYFAAHGLTVPARYMPEKPVQAHKPSQASQVPATR